MKNLILGTFILIAVSCNSPVKSQEKNTWLKYYAYIDTAEIAIIDSTYPKAIAYYEKAFKLVEHPFGKDYYNAVLCFDHIGKTMEAIFYMGKLAEKGFDINYFEDNPYLINVKHSKEWEQFVAAYPAYREKFLKDTIATALNKEFETMNERDQYYVKKKAEPGGYDSVSLITYKNIRRFIEIIDKYGFPDENMVGITTLPYNTPYYLLLMHFQEGKTNLKYPKFSAQKKFCLNNGMDYNSIDLIGILKKAIWEGKLHPNILTSLNLASNKYGQIILLQVDDTIAQINYSDSLKNKIDSTRKEIGLCELKVLRKKGLFSTYKIDHFRKKIKDETPKSYMEYLDYNTTASEKNFSFGLGSIHRNMFFTDGDPQHKHFLGILKWLTNAFDND